MSLLKLTLAAIKSLVVEILTQGCVPFGLQPYSRYTFWASWAISTKTEATERAGCSQKFLCHLKIRDLCT